MCALCHLPDLLKLIKEKEVVVVLDIAYYVYVLHITSALVVHVIELVENNSKYIGDINLNTESIENGDHIRRLHCFLRFGYVRIRRGHIEALLIV